MIYIAGRIIRYWLWGCGAAYVVGTICFCILGLRSSFSGMNSQLMAPPPTSSLPSNAVEVFYAMSAPDPQTLEVQLSFEMEMPDCAFRDLKDVITGGPVYDSSGQLMPQYAGTAITAAYLPFAGDSSLPLPGLGSYSMIPHFHAAVPTQEPDLRTCAGGRTWSSLVAVTLPATGGPQYFPLDGYDSGFQVILTSMGGDQAIVVGTSVPVDYIGNVSTNGFDVFGSYLGYDGQLEVYTRPFFLYSVPIALLASAPLFSVVALGVLYVRRKGSIRGWSEQDRVALLLGLGAILLGVLPLRAVLVPSSIGATTLLDRWLMTEVSIIVLSVACVILVPRSLEERLAKWLGSGSSGEPLIGGRHEGDDVGANGS